MAAASIHAKRAHEIVEVPTRSKLSLMVDWQIMERRLWGS